jgi:hypothetical protein
MANFCWQSLATSLLLFSLIWLASGRSFSGLFRAKDFLQSFRQFLGLFWMTAPLAWLYAIPVERFLDMEGATRANLWLLGIVAVWRVVLITRVISVVLGVGFWQIIWFVMLFADTVAITLLSFVHLPIPVSLLAIMGGVRGVPAPLTESESAVLSAANSVKALGMLTWLIWFVGSVVMMIRRLPSFQESTLGSSRPIRISMRLWSLGVFSLFIWIPVLPYTQPEQQRRHQVETAFSTSRLEEGLAILSRHTRDDFPPYWEPPPRIAYEEKDPDILELVLLAHEQDSADWVRQLFLEKFELRLRRASNIYKPQIIRRLSSDQLNRYLELLESQKFQPEFLALQVEMFQAEIERNQERTEVQRQRIRKIFALDETNPATLEH